LGDIRFGYGRGRGVGTAAVPARPRQRRRRIVTTLASLDAKLDRVVRRHAELADALANPENAASDFGKPSKEYSTPTPMVEAIAELRNAQRELADLEQIQASETDGELRALAVAEMPALQRRIPEIEQRIKVMLLPKDEADERNAILEVRAGTGGE